MQDQEQDAEAAAPEEVLLWQQLRLGQPDAAAAREQLISRYLWLARVVAEGALRDRGLAVDLDRRDLVQLATLGLIEAVDRYDTERNVPFTAYARKRIHGAVISGIERNSEYRAQMSWLHQVHKDRTDSVVEASSQDGRLKRLAEVAIGLAIGFMLEDTGMCASEEHKIGTQYDVNELQVLQQQLRVIVDGLPGVMSRVVELHYFNDLSFAEVGAIVGLTRGRVAQLHGQAISEIRQRLRLVGSIDVRA
ncbi:sigma-70 family RNA polymerase sigma factor [Solimonas sp. K1W22B-7]|uniref:sigma-70 family RNA polymerase sigma factor n=1 Tax=Solimonas sp. K1W22B-7 TaxID=2303331 RepID=UPI000E332735|nr:sigma-70 family RNA polymerase sigma factor [Solimonas sp. K1W22B-7]AXQ28070.1 sigma-70 family RNA polymerase sigma factor [Solimonas sp. K1W22B-7]